MNIFCHKLTFSFSIFLLFATNLAIAGVPTLPKVFVCISTTTNQEVYVLDQDKFQVPSSNIVETVIRAINLQKSFLVDVVQDSDITYGDSFNLRTHELGATKIVYTGTGPYLVHRGPAPFFAHHPWNDVRLPQYAKLVVRSGPLNATYEILKGQPTEEIDLLSKEGRFVFDKIGFWSNLELGPYSGYNMSLFLSLGSNYTKGIGYLSKLSYLDRSETLASYGENVVATAIEKFTCSEKK